MNAYLDANIFVYASTSLDSRGESCPEILDWLAKGKMSGVTSMLTFDELFYQLNRLCGFEKAVLLAENFLTAPNLALAEVNSAVITSAFNLIKRLKLHPRDAIHLATAQIRKADVIIPEDRDFSRATEPRQVNAGDFVRRYKG